MTGARKSSPTRCEGIANALRGLERWIAEQRPWEATPGGWTVPGELQGWRFRVEAVPGGVRVVASANGGEPAVWIVPGRS
jgi:hypothetical protein